MERKVLTAPNGYWYCNHAEKIVASVVYLAERADETAWVLIDDAEKQRLEAEWYPEVIKNVNH